MNMRKTLCGIVMTATLFFVGTTNSSASVSGDVDDDGVVRLADALLVLRSAAGTATLTPVQRFACDVAGGGEPLPAPDGVCDVIDGLFILRKAYGLVAF